MKLWELESALGGVKTFEDPVAQLEQYPTSAHLAAQVVHTMDSSFDDICGKVVCDLGCGTGMLSIAAALMGADYVLGVEVDRSAIDIASQNAADMDLDTTVDCCQADVLCGSFISEAPNPKKFDVVVMNPPFGTRRKGVDMAFLQTAVQLSRGAVYSMHKTTTRDYIHSKARTWGADAQVLAELKFDVGHLYRFHKATSVDVAVDFWRFDVSSVPDNFEFGSLSAPPSDKIGNTPSSVASSQSNKKRRPRGRAARRR